MEQKDLYYDQQLLWKAKEELTKQGKIWIILNTKIYNFNLFYIYTSQVVLKLINLIWFCFSFPNFANILAFNFSKNSSSMYNISDIISTCDWVEHHEQFFSFLYKFEIKEYLWLLFLFLKSLFFLLSLFQFEVIKTFM